MLVVGCGLAADDAVCTFAGKAAGVGAGVGDLMLA